MTVKGTTGSVGVLFSCVNALLCVEDGMQEEADVQLSRMSCRNKLHYPAILDIYNKCQMTRVKLLNAEPLNKHSGVQELLEK